MTLSPQEFMRRFLLHVLPGGFHRIRHYGLLANGSRRADLARVRQALQVEAQPAAVEAQATTTPAGSPGPVFVCRQCGRALLVIQTFWRDDAIRGPPAS
jgi:Putative transposase